MKRLYIPAVLAAAAGAGCLAHPADADPGPCRGQHPPVNAKRPHPMDWIGQGQKVRKRHLLASEYTRRT